MACRGCGVRGTPRRASVRRYAPPPARREESRLPVLRLRPARHPRPLPGVRDDQSGLISALRGSPPTPDDDVGAERYARGAGDVLLYRLAERAGLASRLFAGAG